MLALSVIAIATARARSSVRGWAMDCHHPRRRACGRGLRRADAAPEADRDHDFPARSMGMAGAPFPYYIAISNRSPPLPCLRRQLHRHADDRGTTSWVGPLSRHSARHAAAGRDRDHLVGGQSADRSLLLVGFVIVAPKGIVGLVQDFIANVRLRRRAADLALSAWPVSPTSAGSALMAEPLLNVEIWASASAASWRSTASTCRSRRASGSADRTQRLGKSTLDNCMCGTLTNENRTVRFDGQFVTWLAAHRTHDRGMARSFQLPRPFTDAIGVGEPVHPAALHRQHPRGAPTLSPAEIDDRCAELIGLVGLSQKAKKLPRDLTHVEMRKLELARALAAEPKLPLPTRRWPGLSQSEVTDIVDLLIKLNERVASRSS